MALSFLSRFRPSAKNEIDEPEIAVPEDGAGRTGRNALSAARHDTENVTDLGSQSGLVRPAPAAENDPEGDLEIDEEFLAELEAMQATIARVLLEAAQESAAESTGSDAELGFNASPDLGGGDVQPVISEFNDGPITDAAPVGLTDEFLGESNFPPMGAIVGSSENTDASPLPSDISAPGAIEDTGILQETDGLGTVESEDDWLEDFLNEAEEAQAGSDPLPDTHQPTGYETENAIGAENDLSNQTLAAAPLATEPQVGFDTPIAPPAISDLPIETPVPIDAPTAAAPPAAFETPDAPPIVSESSPITPPVSPDLPPPYEAEPAIENAPTAEQPLVSEQPIYTDTIAEPSFTSGQQLDPIAPAEPPAAPIRSTGSNNETYLGGYESGDHSDVIGQSDLVGNGEAIDTAQLAEPPLPTEQPAIETVPNNSEPLAQTPVVENVMPDLSFNDGINPELGLKTGDEVIDAGAVNDPFAEGTIDEDFGGNLEEEVILGGEGNDVLPDAGGPDINSDELGGDELVGDQDQNPELAVAPAIGTDTVISLDFSSVVRSEAQAGAYQIVVSGVPENATFSAGEPHTDGSWAMTVAQIIGLTITLPADASAIEQLSALTVDIVDTTSGETVQKASIDGYSFDPTLGSVSLVPAGMPSQSRPVAEATNLPDAEEPVAGNDVEITDNTNGNIGSDADPVETELSADPSAVSATEDDLAQATAIQTDPAPVPAADHLDDTNLPPIADENVAEEAAPLPSPASDTSVEPEPEFEPEPPASTDDMRATDAPTEVASPPQSIPDHAANGTVVGTVSASDPDSGESFTYGLTDNAGGRFAIDRETGEISVANGSLLQFEDATSYRVTVRVTDSGGNIFDEVMGLDLANVIKDISGAVPENDTPLGNDGNSVVTDELDSAFAVGNQDIPPGVADSGSIEVTVTEEFDPPLDTDFTSPTVSAFEAEIEPATSAEAESTVQMDTFADIEEITGAALIDTMVDDSDDGMLSDPDNNDATSGADDGVSNGGTDVWTDTTQLQNSEAASDDDEWAVSLSSGPQIGDDGDAPIPSENPAGSVAGNDDDEIFSEETIKDT